MQQLFCFYNSSFQKNGSFSIRSSHFASWCRQTDKHILEITIIIFLCHIFAIFFLFDFDHDQSRLSTGITRIIPQLFGEFGKWIQWRSSSRFRKRVASQFRKPTHYARSSRQQNLVLTAADPFCCQCQKSEIIWLLTEPAKAAGEIRLIVLK